MNQLQHSDQSEMKAYLSMEAELDLLDLELARLLHVEAAQSHGLSKKLSTLLSSVETLFARRDDYKAERKAATQYTAAIEDWRGMCLDAATPQQWQRRAVQAASKLEDMVLTLQSNATSAESKLQEQLGAILPTQ